MDLWGPAVWDSEDIFALLVKLADSLESFLMVCSSLQGWLASLFAKPALCCF